jgi:lysophospholipase L1-like esterase
MGVRLRSSAGSLLLLAASIACGLAILEVGARYLVNDPLAPNRAADLEGWIAEFVTGNPAIEPESRDAFLQVMRNLGGTDPLHQESANPTLVYELQPGCDIRGIIRTNSDGFRDDEFAPGKPDTTYRVCVAGDSNTFGWWVRGSETYAQVLERKLNAQARPGRSFEVYNLGVPGYNTAQNVEMIITTAERFQPDFIVVGHTFNDSFVGSDGGLFRRYRYSSYWEGYNWLSLAWYRYQHSHRHDSLVSFAYSRLNLFRTDVTARGRSAPIPALAVFVPPLPQDTWQTGQHHIDLGHAYWSGVPVVELSTRFGQAGWSKALSEGVHPTPLGHELAADAIFEFMRAQGIASDWLVPVPET